MNKRLGFIGIIIHNRKVNAPKVNQLLTEYGNLIVGRMGMPYDKKDCSVISLIVDSDTDSLGMLTGKLGQIEGISVKSALSKEQ
jgi:putative iron-only hydrogenase system regulator